MGEYPILAMYVHPPIPARCYDWCAFRDPEGPYGWGATEDAAKADLLDQEEVSAAEKG